LNNSRKDYFKIERAEIIELLAKKLSIHQINEVIRLYLLCLDVGGIVAKIRQDGVHEIYESVQKHFQYDEVLFEVPIGSRVCDIVLFSGHNIVAIEVKSASDRVDRAVAQTIQYAEWGNAVYLAYDAKHANEVKNLNQLPDGIGLLEYRDGDIHEIRKATSHSIPNEARLRLMSHRFLREIASRFSAPFYGSKKKIAETLARAQRRVYSIAYFFDNRSLAE
jgi:hypothetical protein